MKKFIIVYVYTFLLGLPGITYAEITFHSVEQGQKIIIDETYEKYFSRLQSAEMMAKTAGKVKDGDLGQMRKDTRKVYQQAVKEFTSEDKTTLTWYVNQYSSIFKKSYPTLARTPWKFVKLDNYIEGSLPHTREDTIVLHDALVKQLTRARQQQGGQALVGIGTVLVHELIHVAQRNDMKSFERVYQQWGFKRVAINTNSKWMLEQQLINPDGTNIEWIYPVKAEGKKMWILPVVTWSEGKQLKIMPFDFRMTAITVKQSNNKWKIAEEENGRPQMKDLAAYNDYINAFPGVNSHYHPNEIIADMIVTMMIYDHFVDKQKLQPQAIKGWETAFSPLRKLTIN